MIERICEFMDKWHMVSAGDRVLVGVSGGADSICLCLILKELSTQMKFSMEVIHVEHGIRGEASKRDAIFVKQFCREQKLTYREFPVDVPAYAKKYHMGDEEAARKLRYDIFVKAAKEKAGTKIALAHHMEDNAETMLFQLARGSGLDGLCGMRPVRAGEDGECYIRPLLEISREQIEQYLSARGQAFCTDATNEELVYSRNRIRHNILPQMQEINAQAVLHMNQTAQRLWELREYLEEETARALQAYRTKDGQQYRISVQGLQQLPKALRMRVLHEAVAETAQKRKDITGAHLEAVADLLEKQTGRRVDLPYGIVAKREYDAIVLQKDPMESVENERPEIQISQEWLEACLDRGDPCIVPTGIRGESFALRIFQFNGNIGEIPRKMYTKWFDYDKIRDGFSIRTRRKQDYFVFDGEGHRKKLADYFINEKVSADRRDKIWLVAQDAQIHWIVGGRMGADCMVDTKTKIVLELIYKGGTKDDGL